jgi:predicted small secreted protein
MRKFLFVLLIVLLGIGVLAACAPIEKIGNDAGDYVKTLPTWAIIVGAIVLFLIGFRIIWKLIPGFVKFIALIALVVVIGGIALGLWSVFGIDKEDIDKTIDNVGNTINTIESLIPQSSESPR